MSRKNSRRKIRSFLDGLKKNSVCLDCGLTERLTFDHQLGEMKRFDLARSTKYPISLVIKEISKCQIVCVTCHRLREDARLKDKRYQETKSHVEAISKAFLLLAILSGSDVAYKEYRDISREKEKKKKDRQRYKRNKTKAKNFESIPLLPNDLPLSSQNNYPLIQPKLRSGPSAAPSGGKLLYTRLFDEYRPDSVKVSGS
jgi:hypothetical protein